MKLAHLALDYRISVSRRILKVTREKTTTTSLPVRRKPVMAITIKLDDAQRALLINVILGGARPKNKSEAFQHQRIYEALDFRSVVRGGVEGEPKEFELDRPDFDTLYDEADSKVFERQALVGAQGVVYKPMIEALK